MCENEAYITGDSDTKDLDIFVFDVVGFSDCIFRLLRRIAVNYEYGQLGDIRSGFSKQLSSCHAKRLQRNTKLAL